MNEIIEKKTILGDRTKYVGASDVPALMGDNNLKSPLWLMYEKTSIVQPDEENLYMVLGNVLEKKVQQKYNLRFCEYEDFYNVDDLEIKSHIDGVFTTLPVLHKKAFKRGLIHPTEIKATKDPKKAEPRYYAQAQTQMLTTGAKQVRFLVVNTDIKIINNLMEKYRKESNSTMISTSGLLEIQVNNFIEDIERLDINKMEISEFTVKRDDKYIKKIIERSSVFWKYKKIIDDDLFIDRVNYKSCPKLKEYITAFLNEADITLSGAQKLDAEIKEYISEYKSGSIDYEKLRGLLVNYMLSTNVRKLELDEITVTLKVPKKQYKESVDVDKLKREYPEVYKFCVKKTKQRPHVQIRDRINNIEQERKNQLDHTEQAIEKYNIKAGKVTENITNENQIEMELE